MSIKAKIIILLVKKENKAKKIYQFKFGLFKKLYFKKLNKKYNYK